MVALWDTASAAAAVGAAATGDWTAHGVSIDTRTLVPGDLFVALAGDLHDGHDFVADAFARGASAAMVSRPVAGLPSDAPLLLVPDVLPALAQLGAAARARAKQLCLIGVTGSVGKTGTKDMLAAMLQPSGSTVASAKSLNNHFGVPLTLARIPADTRYAVIEMGTSARGEIAAHAQLAQPDVAMVTTVAPAHMQSFRSLAEVAEAKSEIYQHLRPGGTAIVPVDCSEAAVLMRHAQAAADHVLGFGEASDADARLLQCSVVDQSTAVRSRIGDQEVAYRIGSPGRHLAVNSLAAMLAVRSVGADLARACCALAGWTVPAGRGNRITVELDGQGSFLLVDESYNANPASMRAALEGLAAETCGLGGDGRPGRRLAFLGDMLELGGAERRYHVELAKIEAVNQIDLVYACGPRMRAMFEGLPPTRRGGWKPSAEELAQCAQRLVRPGDVAMVKGSHGARTSAIAEALKSAGTLE